MNVIVTTPDVHLFVTAVRERLADLSADEREELVGGLEADISDLVAEHGVEALPDPGSYAAELRVAAGFTPESAPTDEGARVGLAAWVTTVLDRAHERWEGFAGGVPGSPWEFLVSLRPAWWVLRAWVALQLVDLLLGSGSYNYGLSVVPSLHQWGVPLLLLAVAVSVQLGRGKLWPGRKRSGAFGRVVLLGLNAFAVALVPVTFDSVFTTKDAALYHDGVEQSYSQPPGEGLSFNGEPIANIYPYDAAGHLLTGVQLVDRQGRRLKVTQDPYNEGTGWGEFVHVPWLNGRTELYSVFPLPEQTLDTDTLVPVGDPRLQSPPFASLPPVTLAGVTPSVLTPGTDAAAAKKVQRKKAARN